MSLARLSLVLMLVGCDAPADPDLTTRALTLTPTRDPLVVAIADTTSVLSDAGIAIRDSEWWILQQGLEASTLPLEPQRAVLDQLALVAPYADLRLPAALRLDERFAPPEKRLGAWRTSDERVAIYALPSDIQGAIARLVADANGAIVLVEVRLVRRDNDLVGAELSLSWSDCGWCQDGTRVVIDRYGQIVEQSWPQALNASGYCC